MVVGRRVPVVHQEVVRDHPIAEPRELEVPVVPPARVLLAEQEHQDHGSEDGAAARPGHDPGAASTARLIRGVGMVEKAQQDRDRDDRDEPECAGHAVEQAVGVVDPEAYGVRFHGRTLLGTAGGYQTRRAPRSSRM